MGRVQVDIYKRERQWINTSLSDVDVVRGLLKFRDTLDIYYNNRYNNGDDCKDTNIELVLLYVDLDILIDKCNFTYIEQRILHLMGKGFEPEEIEYAVGKQDNHIKTIFNRLCREVAQEHDRQWFIWANKNFTDHPWRVCSVCGNNLPMTSRFFDKETRLMFGFRYICKSCRK